MARFSTVSTSRPLRIQVLTALRALDGLFAVELSELGNDLLLMPDLGLVVEPGTPLLIAQGFLFFGVDGVIACEEGGGGVFDLDDLCDCAVEKIPVMGDNDNGSAVVGEIVFQPSDTAQIQVVGGLVEHDHIRALQKQACQGDTGLLAAGERRDLLVELIVPESETAQDTGDLTLVGIAVHHLKAVQEIGVGLDQLIEGIALDCFHFPLVL